jgi:uncharacterized damage-inducible protein DinB
MFHRIDDFREQFSEERDNTLKLMRSLTDEALGQPIIEGGRTLGFLAWHITGTFREMLGHAGLALAGPNVGDPMPARAAEIADAYERASAAALEAVTSQWTDDRLEEEADMYGYRWKLGFVLETLIRHEAHHRGQMTVLMRQAGLPVAGAYGPSREEWAAWGMPAHP